MSLMLLLCARSIETGNNIEPIARTHDIRMPRRRLHKVIITALDESKVLIEDTVNVSTAFFDVSFDSPGEHEVRVAILVNQRKMSYQSKRQLERAEGHVRHVPQRL